ncbi:MAG: hypothetical protein NTW83_11355 [Cyanobacteria bacterium]|nr:hypothetical protein [Cyanobacteriota bacterium]
MNRSPHPQWPPQRTARLGTEGTPEVVIENLERLEAISTVAASHQVQLLAFPELYLSGYALSPETAWRLAEPLNGPSLQLVAGRECLYDAIALFDSGGTLLRNYRKTHLWAPDEALLWTAGYRDAEEGDAYTVQRVNGFPLGLLNCYEGEFPELTRLLMLAGARLVLIPTAADAWMLLSDGRRTDRPYPDVSRTLLPAHAFSSQCFVA